SDKTGETEWWRLPANGVGDAEALTGDAHVLRWDGVPSPDGQWLAYHDKNQELWLYSIPQKRTVKIDATPDGDFQDLAWSADGKWLAYVRPTPTFGQVWVYGVADGRRAAVTSDRVDSYSPAFSPDGKWLYFLSDRTFQSLVRAPWGPRQPEPFFDRQTRIYHVALSKGLRSPFQAADELQPKPGAAASDTTKRGGGGGATPAAATTIDLDGIQQRLSVVPLPAGNYRNLSVTASRLFFLSGETAL